MKTLDGSLEFIHELKTVSVPAPELGCNILLRELTLEQLAQLDKDVTKQLALMIVDENGDRIYVTDAQIENLRHIKASVGRRLQKEAAALNGLSEEAEQEIIKNWLAGLSEVSESV